VAAQFQATNGQISETDNISSRCRGPLQDLIDEKELRVDRRPEVKDVEKSMDDL